MLDVGLLGLVRLQPILMYLSRRPERRALGRLG